MNCLQCQASITAFIDDKLTEEQLEDFIDHVRHCDSCYEELDIYYTLLVGMKQLDDDGNLASDFSNELAKKITKNSSRIKRKKHRQTITVSITVIALIMFVCSSVYFYGIYRYQKEQNILLQNQGEYYFKRTFGEKMFIPVGNTIRDPYIDHTITEDTFFDKIDEYNKNKNENGDNNE